MDDDLRRGDSRRINDGIERGRVQRSEITGFVCECGQRGCNEIVELSLADFAAARAGHASVVALIHAFGDRVERRDGYALTFES